MKRTKYPTTGTPRKDGQPRYEQGKYPVYDRIYRRYVNQSSILHEQKRSVKNSVAWQMAGSIDDLRSLLAGYTGNENGNIPKVNELSGDDMQVSGKIAAAQARLKKIHIHWQKWRRGRVRSGKDLKPTNRWPSHILGKRLEAEAILDFRRREAFAIGKAIETKEKEQAKEQKQNMLPYGPIGTEMARGWGVQAADGQPVSYRKNIPYIDCQNSPYDQMPLFHYRKMSRNWVEGKLGFDKGERPHRRKKKESAYQQKELTKEDWPEWPKEVKKIDEMDLAKES
jgi:hypothetical protein